MFSILKVTQRVPPTCTIKTSRTPNRGGITGARTPGARGHDFDFDKGPETKPIEGKGNGVPFGYFGGRNTGDRGRGDGDILPRVVVHGTAGGFQADFGRPRRLWGEDDALNIWETKEIIQLVFDRETGQRHWYQHHEYNSIGINSIGINIIGINIIGINIIGKWNTEQVTTHVQMEHGNTCPNGTPKR